MDQENQQIHKISSSSAEPRLGSSENPEPEQYPNDDNRTNSDMGDLLYPNYYAELYKRKEQDDIFEQIPSRWSFSTVILCWIFGILFTEIFIKGGFGLSVPLLTVLFYMIAIWLFSKKDGKKSKASYALLIPIGLIAFGFLFQDSESTYLINTLVLLTLIALQLSIMSGTSAGSAFSPQSFYSTLVSFLVRPFAYLDLPFKVLGKNTAQKNKNSKSMTVFIGLVIALPIAAVFTALFVNADSAFRYLVQGFFDNISVPYSDVVFDFVFGTIGAVFLSAWLITMRARKRPEEREFRLKKGLNSLLLSTVLVVINFVHIIFVTIQFGYLFAGMKLPDDMTYAEYARSGFFELCGVLCASIALITIFLIFSQKDSDRRMHKSVSLLLTVFILCNFVVIASAVYRMLTYISVYDLSVKRFMVTWLIVLFAFCMAGAVIKIWYRKFRILSFVAATVILMTSGLNIINVNDLIAEYNVDQYLKSIKTEHVRKIDVSYLASLGPSAAGATVKLYQNTDGNMKQAVYDSLEQQKRSLDRKSWKNFSLSDLKARERLNTILE